METELANQHAFQEGPGPGASPGAAAEPEPALLEAILIPAVKRWPWRRGVPWSCNAPPPSSLAHRLSKAELRLTARGCPRLGLTAPLPGEGAGGRGRGGGEVTPALQGADLSPDPPTARHPLGPGAERPPVSQSSALILSSPGGARRSPSPAAGPGLVGSPQRPGTSLSPGAGQAPQRWCCHASALLPGRQSTLSAEAWGGVRKPA